MAEYETLVSVVHQIYRQRGGTYTEQTTPRLGKAAGMLYQQNREFVQSATRSELEKQEQAIVNAIREASD